MTDDTTPQADAQVTMEKVQIAKNLRISFSDAVYQLPKCEFCHMRNIKMQISESMVNRVMQVIKDYDFLVAQNKALREGLEKSIEWIGDDEEGGFGIPKEIVNELLSANPPIG